MIAYVWLESASCLGRAQAGLEAALKVLASFSPIVEPDPDGAGVYLDVRGLERLFGPPEALAAAISSKLAQDLPLPRGEGWDEGILPGTRVGIAVNRLTARLAARLAPAAGWRVVAPGTMRDFLEPLPIGLLPLSEESLERLELLGVRTIGQLLRLPRAALGGQVGLDALALARALEVEDELLRAWRDDEWLILEADLDEPIETREQLVAALVPLAERLAEALRESYLGAQVVRLRLAGRGAVCQERQMRLLERTAQAARLLEYLIPGPGSRLSGRNSLSPEKRVEVRAFDLGLGTPDSELDIGPERLELAVGALGPLGLSRRGQPGLFDSPQASRRALVEPALAELRGRGLRLRTGVRSQLP